VDLGTSTNITMEEISLEEATQQDAASSLGLGSEKCYEKPKQFELFPMNFDDMENVQFLENENFDE